MTYVAGNINAGFIYDKSKEIKHDNIITESQNPKQNKIISPPSLLWSQEIELLNYFVSA